MSTCKRCGHAVHRGRCKKAIAEAAEPPAPSAAGGSKLTIEPGHGVEVWTENGLAQVMQGDTVHGYTRTEWRVIVAHLHDWLEAI